MLIATLTTCHNRKDCTLAALSGLHAQALPEGVSLEHVIVDDGSSDGTAAAVKKEFPDVEVVAGEGDLYWAGGMRFGWEQAVRHMEFDHLFVYNDDVRLEPTALADLLAACTDRPGPVVVAGSFLSLDGRRTTYGGRRRSSRRHPLKFAEIVEPDGTVQEADTLNMNGALISKSALDSVGFLSNYFVHSGADFEYGLKLRKAGGRVLVAPRYIGRCDMNPASEQLPENEASLRDGLRKLFDSKREPFRQRLAYYRRHGGALWPAWWLAPYVTIWFRHLGRRFSRANRTAQAR